MADWAVYYEGGASFTSDDGQPHEAPRWGVLVVANKDREVGKSIWHRADYYVWRDEWVPVDRVGRDDYDANLAGGYKVTLFGRMTKRDEMCRAYQQAVDDDRLPFKSGLRDGELGAP